MYRAFFILFIEAQEVVLVKSTFCFVISLWSICSAVPATELVAMSETFTPSSRVLRESRHPDDQASPPQYYFRRTFLKTTNTEEQMSERPNQSDMCTPPILEETKHVQILEYIGAWSRPVHYQESKFGAWVGFGAHCEFLLVKGTVREWDLITEAWFEEGFHKVSNLGEKSISKSMTGLELVEYLQQFTFWVAST